MSPGLRPAAVLLTAALLLAGACARRPAPAPPADSEEAIRERLRDKPAQEVVDEAARAEFIPPADGRLSEEQVRMYLEIRALEEQIRLAAGPGADAASAGVRASQELGYNPREYRWVEERAREARMAGLAGDLDERVAESRARILRSLEERRRSLSDPATIAEVEQQIAEIRRLLAEAPPAVPAAVRHNAELLARHGVGFEAAEPPPGGPP